MADDIKVNLKVVADPQGAAEAGKADAAAYSDNFKKLRNKEEVRAMQEQNRQLLQSLQNKSASVGATVDRTLKMRETNNLRYMRLTESMVKNYSMLSGVVASPGGGLTTMFSARQAFQARRDQASRDRLTGGKGESITGSIFVTTGLVAAATGLGFSLKLLSVTATEAAKAIRFAQSMYAKASTSGFGLGGQIRRTTAANILGVDEKEIMKFGAALAYIQPRIRQAQDSLIKTAMPLAKLAIDFEILKLKFEAFAASIAAKIAPALELIIDTIGNLIQNIDSKQMDAVVRAMEITLGIITEFAGAFGTFIASIVTGINVIIESLEYLYKALYNLTLNLLKLLHLADKSEAGYNLAPQETFKNTIDWAFITREINDAFGKLGGDLIMGKTDKKSKGVELPAPSQFMKQMPASTWERMGLVVGGGGGTNYAKQTSDNTKNTVKVLHQIAAKIGVGDRSQASIYSLP